jgi:hypothetical protein
MSKVAAKRAVIYQLGNLNGKLRRDDFMVRDEKNSKTRSGRVEYTKGMEISVSDNI